MLHTEIPIAVTIISCVSEDQGGSLEQSQALWWVGHVQWLSRQAAKEMLSFLRKLPISVSLQHRWQRQPAFWGCTSATSPSMNPSQLLQVLLHAWQIAG